MRNLEFTFNWPGLIEAIAFEPGDEPEALFTEGYRSVWVSDLMIDYDPRTGRPYCFMSLNFDKSYPLVIWALKMHVHERFNVPQAGLTNVPLHVAFSWAYYHFILEDGARLPQPFTVVRIDPQDYTQVALGYALTTTTEEPP